MTIQTKRLMEEAMALSIPAYDSRGLVLTVTYFVVVFSILVQSLTLGPVIRMNGGPPAAPQSSAYLNFLFERLPEATTPAAIQALLPRALKPNDLRL